MKVNSIRVSDLMFEDIASRKQRASLNELLRTRLGAPPGAEIAYRDVCPVQRRGGVYLASMEAKWERDSLTFKVKLLNASGQICYIEDSFLQREDIEIGNAA